jgi:hypothetical protein
MNITGKRLDLTNLILFILLIFSVLSVKTVVLLWLAANIVRIEINMEG